MRHGKAAGASIEHPHAQLVALDFVPPAMNDDLGTPAAVAAIHDVVREGNKLLSGGDSAALRGNAASVLAMLDVLGLHPHDPAWATGSRAGDARLTTAVDVLVAGLLEQRAEARAAKDFAAADAIRDTIKAAGIEIEDTPTGPKWSLEAGNN